MGAKGAERLPTLVFSTFADRSGAVPLAISRVTGKFMRTGIATVSISGNLEEKIAAIAAAGFDGIEIFEQDFIADTRSPRDRA